MARFSYRPKSQVHYRDRPHRIIRPIATSQVLLAAADGEFVVAQVSDLAPAKEAAASSPRPVDAINEADLEEARRRLRVIQPLLDLLKNRCAAVAIAAAEARVHPATIMRWLKAYQDRNLLSDLAPQRRQRNMPSRLPKKVQAILKGVIEDFYLTLKKPSAERTIEEVLRRCRAARLQSPHRNTIHAHLRKIDLKWKLTRREGRKIAHDHYGEVLGPFPGGRWPLDVIQIDHTLLDIQLVSAEDRLPIGRPWLTLAIDVFSRMIVGYYLSLDHPSAYSVGLCLSHAALAKEAELDWLRIEGEWPVWGLWGTIHADNGKDFRSNTILKACEQHGITIQWRPVKTPHYGGHIERLLGTVAREIHAVDGTTFSNPGQRKQYKSEAQATMTLSELRRWLLNFFIGVYHNRKHDGIGMPPLAKWREGILGKGRQKGIGLPEPVQDPEQLRLDFLPYREASVQREGIVWDKVWYYDPVLRPWVRAHHGRGGRKFIIRRDPTDISRLYFFDPQVGRYFEIPFRNPTRPSISIWELREAERFLRQDGIREIDEETIFRARERMREIEATAGRETKRQRRQKERAKHHAERRSTMPLLPSEPPQPYVALAGRQLTVVVDNTSVASDGPAEFDFDLLDATGGVHEW